MSAQDGSADRLTLILLGLLGLAVLAAGLAAVLAVGRLVVRYHLEDVGVGATLFSYTLRYARYDKIRSFRVVSGWRIVLSPTLKLGNRLRGPGVEIMQRFGGVMITPENPEWFAGELRRRARLP